METLLGGLLGGAFRMLPELLKWLDRKDERQHELDMLDKQLDADRQKIELNIKQIVTQGDITLDTKEIDAIIEATKAQATITGVKWVDGASSLMRPLITFWWVIVMYSLALVGQYYSLYSQSHGNVDIILKLWGNDEKAIVMSIISFWFCDRSLRKK